MVDSRQADDGTSIRRRRACLGCRRRFTTFERLDEVPLLVVKRSGDREPFDRTKVITGLLAATKGRPVDVDQLEELASSVEEALRSDGTDVASNEVGLAVLERLRELDVVAAVRFASVYKEFDDLADFERELTELTHSALTKSTQPKHH